jgi:protein-tyrosine phosphatase
LEDVFWISGESAPHLAIVLRPRGDDWLEDEIVRMKRGGVKTVVSMLESDEAALLGLAEEGKYARQHGLSFLSYPIPDRQTPDDRSAFCAFAADLAGRLRAGEHIGVHCRASIGRATIAAACTLIHLGWKPEAALSAIEIARGCPVPDTSEQEDWILHYEARQ